MKKEEIESIILIATIFWGGHIALIFPTTL